MIYVIASRFTSSVYEVMHIATSKVKMWKVILITLFSTVSVCKSDCIFPWTDISPNSTKCYVVSEDPQTYIRTEQVHANSLNCYSCENLCEHWITSLLEINISINTF